MAVLSASVAGLLMHPLLARVLLTDSAPSSWECLAAVPDKAAYTYAVPAQALTQEYRMEYADWVRMTSQSGMQVGQTVSVASNIHGACCALLDTRRKKTYFIDLVGECTNGKLCLTLIHYSRKEVDRKARDSLVRHAATIRRVCAEQYALAAITMVINVYFSDPLEEETQVKMVAFSNRDRRRPQDHPTG